MIININFSIFLTKRLFLGRIKPKNEYMRFLKEYEKFV